MNNSSRDSRSPLGLFPGRPAPRLYDRVVPVSGETRGLGEATGRSKKMEATCLIDHKWRYNETLSIPRVAPTSRLAGPLRSQDRPWIGRGDRDAARVRGAHT